MSRASNSFNILEDIALGPTTLACAFLEINLNSLV